MIKGNNRKDKIETLRGLLSGAKTLKDIRQDQCLTVFPLYAECSEAPGALYDKQGSPITAEQVAIKEAALMEEGYLVFSETRSYNTKAELHGFFEA
jgi:hypothetical protein